ncbi:MAG: hypothetical protein CR964_00905 [Rhodobacterales bacterium]|nr:MAG: hypothetical protein CR964_00905 [Rhodobacterales bacterium]
MAYIGPEVAVPQGTWPLGCGDQIRFAHEMRDQVRYVTSVKTVERGGIHADPQKILKACSDSSDASGSRGLRVVA